MDENDNIVELRPGFYGLPPLNPTHTSVAIGGIGPKQDIQLGIRAISKDEAEILKDNTESLLLIGRINYQDSFDNSVWHVNKFCYRIFGNVSSTENFAVWTTGRKIQAYDTGDLKLTYRLCGHDNCADSQCRSQQ